MSRDIRICFVGDSFVNGTGDETALGWTGRLCAAANARGIPTTYYNLGVRRGTSGNILRRCKHECARRLPDGCDRRVVVSFGVNDTAMESGKVRLSLDESCSNLRQILCDLEQYDQVMVVGPPAVDDEDHNARIGEISRLFAHEAKSLGVAYIELYAALTSDEAYKREISKNDGFHPKSDGYSQIARIVSSSSHWWFRS